MIPGPTTAQEPNIGEWLYKMNEKGYTPENGWYPDFEGNLYYTSDITKLAKIGKLRKRIKVLDDKITYYLFGKKELYKVPLETKEEK